MFEPNLPRSGAEEGLGAATQLPGYRIITELARDGSYVIHRAERDGYGAVLLKRSARGAAGTAVLAALRREHDLLAALDLDGVPRPRSFDDAAGALVLDDPGGESLHTLLARQRLTLRDFFDIALSLASTVAALHRRGIIHKNINPHSVLFDAARRRTHLIGFGLASRLSQDSQAAHPPYRLQGLLAYISPEQTGRMNRMVDYRSDLYSLGATLYQVLVGRPPFDTADPLALIHWHMARIPPAPVQIDADIPEPLSAITMKLLAKTAEERYQSAAGLAADLERCVEQWAAHGAVAPFPLAQRDVSDRFLIPQRLYGRDEEVRTLLAAFERACAGATSLLLVSGYSGVGKTSVVHEVHKPIVARRGQFLWGKFDQLNRNVPYGALLQALRGLMQAVLGESEEKTAPLRAALRDALGVNAGVIAAVVPGTELLLGPQEPVPVLGPTESQNRFNYVFQSFLGVFAGPDQPLVIFLDDLQWADSATLRLLALLLTQPAVPHLLLIGAYRDNEVSADHPLMKTIVEIREAGVPLHEITLPPLRLPHLTEFVRDTLRCDDGAAASLAKLLLRKTDGNPFFVTQFLRSLHHDGLIAFDHALGRWSFDLGRIEQADMTDNVIDLMTRKLQRLSRATREAITLAACVGNTFSLSTLATVCQRPHRAVAAELWEAIREGLVIPSSDRYELLAEAPEEVLASAAPTYRFLHDRVQQAGYALIPAEQKKPLHLQVGRLLRAECGAPVPEERLFEIVNHLNLGQDLLADEDERLDLVRLNLAAGRKAKASAAFRAARDYFDGGLRLLPADGWTSHYELTLGLTMEAAEAEYLCGNFAQAEQAFATLLARTRSPLEKVEVHRMHIIQHENTACYAEAVRVGRQALALFGVTLPEDEAGKAAALEDELRLIQATLGERPIASLEELPAMQRSEIKAVVGVLTAMWAPAYIAGDATLPSLLSAHMVRLSLEHGNTEESAYGYVTHAITIGSGRGDYRSGYEWGRLALAVNERLHDVKRRAKVQHMFSCFVNLWRQPIETCFAYSKEAYRAGVETGDFTYATYGCFHESWYGLLSGMELGRFEREYAPNVAFLKRIKNDSFADAQQVILHWGRNLRGVTRDTLSLSDHDLDEESYDRTYREDPFFQTFLWVIRLAVAVTFERYDVAEAASLRAGAVVASLFGTVWTALLAFYRGLTLAALHPDLPVERQRAARAELAELRQQMARRADNAPKNFRCHALLLEAEIARVDGDPATATALYEQAVRAAEESGRVNDEALAYELFARFWQVRSERVARPLLEAARERYERWGAAGKVRDLEARHPAARRGPATARSGGDGDTIDVATVMKAARAIAGEIEIERLLRTLVRIAIENAGAERGLLLQERGEQLAVVAEGAVDNDGSIVSPPAPLESRPDLAHAIVRFVQRTGESLLVADAEHDPRWLADAYVRAARPKSVLCAAIVHQGKRWGLFYLENRLTTEAFPPARIEMMQILSAQAAIALENARLYDDMRQEAERRGRAEQALREALAQLEELKNRLQQENVYLQEEIRTAHNFEEIVGNSAALVESLHKVEIVSGTDATVLILGETGTGKELFARAIHARSPRKDRPLVKVNCGAIAAGLVESELFGHVKGAFTGALQKRTGRFELADGGTIFLDEVGELPLETQVKLLRILQEQEFEPVGSSHTVRVDVRVIAATNRDLEAAVRAGRFRSDLLYRLNVFPITVPPLRDRRADIPLLAAFFVDRMAKKLGKPFEGFSRQSMERLLGYAWPGNVRELQNIVERAAILAPGSRLEVDPALLGQGEEDHSATPSTLEVVERSYVVEILRKTGGVVEGPQGAATILGLHPNTLRSRIKKLGIQRRDYEMS